MLHARWAMLGVVGAVVPELLTDLGALPPLAESVWWKVGAAKLSGGARDARRGCRIGLGELSELSELSELCELSELSELS